MKAPSCSSRINKEWVQYVLEEHLKKKHHNKQTIPKVEIKDFSIGPGAEAGDGYNSDLVTLDVTASLTTNSDIEETSSLTKNCEIGETSTEHVEFNFMVKFLSTEPGNKAFNQKFQNNSREYAIYSECIEDLNAMQSSHSDDNFGIHIPELIYGRLSEKEFVLVMENIKYSGYKNNDKYKGLDFKHLKEAVNQLARIHSLSYVYNISQPVLDKYPCLEFNSEMGKVVISFFDSYLEGVIALLNAKDKGKLAKKVQSSKENLYDQFLSLKPHTPGGVVCLSHGDFWNNNIMYKEEEIKGASGEVETKLRCKIVDWGNSSMASPVYDLQYLMNSSTYRETRKEHLEEILRFYHTNFTEIVASFSQSVPNWSYDDFLKEWRRLAIHGFFMGLFLIQFTLSKSNPASKPKNDSTILDHSFCFPAKYLVNEIALSLSKLSVNYMLKNPRNKMLAAMMKRMYIPIRDEILSGNNEVMNKRLLDLMLDFDEIGLFDE